MQTYRVKELCEFADEVDLTAVQHLKRENKTGLRPVSRTKQKGAIKKKFDTKLD